MAYLGTSNTYTGTAQLASNIPKGNFLVMECPYKVSFKRLAIKPELNSSHQPWSGLVCGSNDGNAWDIIHSWNDGSFVVNEYSFFNFTANDKSHRFVALVITQLTGGQRYERIGRIKYFGTPAPSGWEDGHLTLGKALTAPRVSGHPAGAETPRAESLVVHYDTTVDSVASGNTVVDTSGNGLNGTLSTESGSGVTYESAGRYFDFHGTGNTGDYVSTVMSNPSGAWTFTLSVWFKMDELQSGLGSPTLTENRRSIFHFREDRTTVLTYAFAEVRNTYMSFAFGDSGNLNATDFAPKQNTWHHMVVSYGGGAGTAKVFIDGVDYTPYITWTTGTLNLDANETLNIGRDGRGNSYWDGGISNFKIWGGVALTADEVAAEYALGRTGKALNITDTAVCLGGTAPRAQLDVRGDILYTGTSRPHALPTMWKHMDMGRNGPGVYPIIGTQGGSKVYNVYCEPDIFGGGWMCFTQIPQTGAGFGHNIVNLYTLDSGDPGNLKRDKFFNVPYNILSNTNGVNCDILVLAYGDVLRYNMQGAKVGAIWRGVDLNKAFDSTLPNGTTITANAAQATSADGINFTSLSADLIAAVGWEFSISSSSGTTGSYNDFNDGTGGFIIHVGASPSYSIYGNVQGPAGNWNWGSSTDFEIVRIFVRPSSLSN